MMLYSPFMWAAQLADITNLLKENPEAAKKGLEIKTENVLTVAQGCKPASMVCMLRLKGVKPSGCKILETLATVRDTAGLRARRRLPVLAYALANKR